MRFHRFLPPSMWCVLLLACCIVLSSCAAPPPQALVPSATAAPPATATPLPLPTTTARPPAATATPAPRALTVWVAEEGPAYEAAQALLSDPASGAGPVEVLARPLDGLRLSLATAALVGDPLPDLLWGDQEALAGLIADGVLQPLGPPSPATLPALRTAATLQGELWGLPVAARGALLLLYNRARVAVPPATTDQLIVAARGAVTPEAAGLVMAWNEAHWVLPWLYAYGGAPTDAEGMALTLDTPELAAALNLVRVLYGAADDDTNGYRQGQRLFAQGNAAFAIDGEWALPALEAVSDTLELGITALPTVPATGRPALAPLGGTFLMLHRDLAGEERERAQALLAWMSSAETQGRIAAVLGRLPAQTEALSSIADAARPELKAAAVAAAQAPGLPPTPAVRCAVFAIDVWLPNVIKGELEPTEAATRMQREAENCLRNSSS